MNSMDPESCYIIVQGACVNNLKNVDVCIPRDRLTVITGLSGSGKSSLAFDTLYAEGQRRYVESLSTYARQFLGRMRKPECYSIRGIPPAIALEQKVSSRNPRSTVGTSTEIYDYLRLLYARAGKTISPVSGREVKKDHLHDILQKTLSYPLGTPFTLNAPLHLPPGRTPGEHLEILQKEGYSRIEMNHQPCRIQDVLEQSGLPDMRSIEIIIDRLTVSSAPAQLHRLAESARTALYEGRGHCLLKVYVPHRTSPLIHSFTQQFEADGLTFEEPTESMFNFNSPLGACPACEGLGETRGIDENRVIPDPALSLYEGAVACWNSPAAASWLQAFQQTSASYHFPIHRPYNQLTGAEKNLLWQGNPDVQGIDAYFRELSSQLHKIQNRVTLARYRGRTTCPSCQGSRLKPAALHVRIGDKNLPQLVATPLHELQDFFRHLSLSPTESHIAGRLLPEIQHRLQLLQSVGLGYLTLDRPSATLSGGESQRISLVTALGSSLVGSLYILDEPSIGLHPRDTGLLIQVLHRLRDIGNTVVVVEHDEEMIRSADHLIDLGPAAGRCGGEIIYQGPPPQLSPQARSGEAASRELSPGRADNRSDSYTMRYLTGEERIEIPLYTRPWNQYIEIKGAYKNNLKRVDVKFPLHVMTVVTGVSGSGKSSLVRDVFYEGMKRILDGASPGVECASIGGDTQQVHAIEFVDQRSIGKSSRSNPATYIGAYDEIRKLFAEQDPAKRIGYTPAYFSFNKEGGRCEECKGEGFITVEMQFMADITLECEVCHGKRFRPEALEILYRGVNIYDVLEMTVDQMVEFLKKQPEAQAKKIIRRLKPLQDVGLGYIRLGQTSSTLSGGENQRVKLASYLGRETQEHLLFVFDEPTTGLHFHDIKTLLQAFYALIAKGHTMVIIEHHPDVIKCADYLIDLGPEGGPEGGYLVCAGTPQEIAACRESYTGRFLQVT
jgi:excinuclease ABC subunit A